jgi:hypothetical protein
MLDVVAAVRASRYVCALVAGRRTGAVHWASRDPGGRAAQRRYPRRKQNDS